MTLFPLSQQSAIARVKVKLLVVETVGNVPSLTCSSPWAFAWEAPGRNNSCITSSGGGNSIVAALVVVVVMVVIA